MTNGSGLPSRAVTLYAHSGCKLSIVVIAIRHKLPACVCNHKMESTTLAYLRRQRQDICCSCYSASSISSICSDSCLPHGLPKVVRISIRAGSVILRNSPGLKRASGFRHSSEHRTDASPASKIADMYVYIVCKQTNIALREARWRRQHNFVPNEHQATHLVLHFHDTSRF